MVQQDFLNLRRAARLSAEAGLSFAHILYVLQLKHAQDENEAALIPLCDQLEQLCQAGKRIDLIIKHRLKPAVDDNERTVHESDEIWTARRLYESVLLLLEIRAMAAARDGSKRSTAAADFANIRRILVLATPLDDTAKLRIARATANLGAVCRDPAVAESHFKSALRTFEQIGKPEEQVNALRLLSNHALKASHYQQALDYIDQEIK